MPTRSSKLQRPKDLNRPAATIVGDVSANTRIGLRYRTRTQQKSCCHGTSQGRRGKAW